MVSSQDSEMILQHLLGQQHVQGLLQLVCTCYWIEEAPHCFLAHFLSAPTYLSILNDTVLVEVEQQELAWGQAALAHHNALVNVHNSHLHRVSDRQGSDVSRFWVLCVVTTTPLLHNTTLEMASKLDPGGVHSTTTCSSLSVC